MTLIIPSLIMITASSNNAGLSTKLEQDVIHAMSAASITLVLFLQLFFSIFLGFFGNNLYYRHIRKKIRKGYHFCKEYESTDTLMVYFFMFFFMLMPNAYLKDKARLKKSLNGMDDFDTSFDDKNVESVTSVSSHYVKKFSKIEQENTFSINWEVLGLSHFNFIWFFYKKMYKYGFIMLASEIIY